MRRGRDDEVGVEDVVEAGIGQRLDLRPPPPARARAVRPSRPAPRGGCGACRNARPSRCAAPSAPARRRMRGGAARHRVASSAPSMTENMQCAHPPPCAPSARRRRSFRRGRGSSRSGCARASPSVPTRPAQDAGQRIEPPPSVPMPSGARRRQRRARTAGGPPGVRSRFQGLRVTPQGAVGQDLMGEFRQRRLADRDRRRRRAAGRPPPNPPSAAAPAPAAEPFEVGSPRMATLSFTVKGTPWSGPSGRTAITAASACRAASRACVEERHGRTG